MDVGWSELLLIGIVALVVVGPDDLPRMFHALGRIIARDGRDGTGRPYYWMGLGRAGEVDEFDEHWGESAYLVAMAWFYDGRDDAGLRTAADELVTGLRERGEAGQVRSFNWQCRAAVQAPAYLR